MSLPNVQSEPPALDTLTSEAPPGEDIFLQDVSLDFDFDFEGDPSNSAQSASITADYTSFGILTPLRQQPLFTDEGPSAYVPSEEGDITQPEEAANEHIILSSIQLTPAEAARLPAAARTTSGTFSPRGRSPTQQLSAQAFSDEVYMSTPVFSLLRAHITVLERMRGGRPVDTIWNPFAVSTLWEPGADFSTPPSLITSLPQHYQPLPSQRLIKHHPVIDLLPWPAVRNKLLFTLSLPADARPPRAKGAIPDVIMNLKFDMMDASGGIRVWGQDPFNQDNWEIGQRFFEYWWWALDNEVVGQSNKLRVGRGEERLRLREIR